MCSELKRAGPYEADPPFDLELETNTESARVDDRPKAARGLRGPLERLRRFDLIDFGFESLPFDQRTCSARLPNRNRKEASVVHTDAKPARHATLLQFTVRCVEVNVTEETSRGTADAHSRKEWRVHEPI